MYLLFKLFICVVTVTLPYWLEWLRGKHFGMKHGWMLVMAAAFFFFASFLPDIHISRETNTFQEHFVGGGLYCACLYVYLKRVSGWRLGWLASLLVLFAFTSALGVANELFEFTVTKLHVIDIDISDTSWDLVANTLGAFTGYAIFVLTRLERLYNR